MGRGGHGNKWDAGMDRLHGLDELDSRNPSNDRTNRMEGRDGLCDPVALCGILST